MNYIDDENQHNINLNKQMKKNMKIKSLRLFIGISIFGGLSSAYLMKDKNKEYVVKVSENFKNSIYDDNNLLKQNEDTKNKNFEDKNITNKTIKKITKLEIDMDKNNDLLMLLDCVSVNKLKISNAQELTSKDIEVINKSSIENIYLSFNQNGVILKNKEKFDIARFKNKNIKIDNDILNFDEVKNIIFLNYIENAVKSQFNILNYDKYKKIDDNLNKILKDLKVDQIADDWDKTLVIANYICDHLFYDKTLKEYISKNDSFIANSIEKEKAQEYNDNTISSVLSSDIYLQTEGICINYSSLFTSLCYKSGIEIYNVTGIDKDINYAHAYNLIKVDGKYKYIDLTDSDNNFLTNIYLTNYIIGDKEIYSKKYYSDILKERLLIETNDMKYISDITPENINESPVKNIVIYNENIAGEKVCNLRRDFFIPSIIGMSSATVATLLSIGEQKIKRKK